MSSTLHHQGRVRQEGASLFASRSYLLVLLTTVLTVVRIDRIALGLSLQDIKADLQLTDVQLGLMSGLSFTLFYAAVGVPIARWADRGSRVVIISMAAALWGAAVCLCGTAASFVQLLLIRIGAAVGEAGCHPASLSLISDRFDRDERPRAVARYMLGLPLALAVGNFVAGWLIELYGWRAMFVIIGVPGLAVSAVAAFTLRDLRPMQQASSWSSTQQARAPGLTQVVSTLWACRSYRHLLLCFSIWGFFGYGILQWQPVFFMRSHDMTTAALGGWLALIYGVGGLLGTFLGGEIASRFAANRERLQLLTIAALYTMLSVLAAGAYMAMSVYVALSLLALCAVSGAASNGPLFAVIQSLVPSHMRATATALLYFSCNLIGMGCGPIVAGMLSDLLQPFAHGESLRYALIALSPGYLWCAWHLRSASRTVTQDLLIVR